MTDRTPITLGELIAALESRPATQLVYFNFALLVPTTLRSWRGDYSQLALGYGLHTWPYISVGDLLLTCKAALDRTFEGYKGGTYRMNHATPIYVDNWGDYTGWAVTRVEDVEIGEGRTILVAEDVDD